jgi:predicted nucleic acid-binding Zn ribbon protein
MPCPQCGEPAERGQLVCTSCGSRLALDHRRPRPAVAALVALLAVVVLGAGAFGFALSEITSDGDDEVTAADRAQQPAPAAAEGRPQRAAQGEGSPPETPATGTEDASGAPQAPKRSLLLDWPDGLTAHTVVLVTTSDGPAARRLARQAARSGIEAGLLRSDDYNLGTGLWIVFAGRFDTRQGAARQASDLAERFPGAYPQLVEPAG